MQDTTTLLCVPGEKVYVIHYGVEHKYVPQRAETIKIVKGKYGLRKDYLLFVGAISGRKNTRNLVKAYGISSVTADCDLVLAGPLSYLSDQTLHEIAYHGLEKQVKLLGYVPEADLPALYSGAIGTVLPSFYEGFGFPLLESMACGTPVLCGNLGASPEIGGSLTIQVDPYDPEAISKGLEELVYHYPHTMEELCRHVQRFTWEKTASQTLELYHAVASQ